MKLWLIIFMLSLLIGISLWVVSLLINVKRRLKKIMATVQDVRDAVGRMAAQVTQENQEVIDKIKEIIDAHPDISGELDELVADINAQTERVSNFVIPEPDVSDPDKEAAIAARENDGSTPENPRPDGSYGVPQDEDE